MGSLTEKLIFFQFHLHGNHLWANPLIPKPNGFFCELYDRSNDPPAPSFC